MKLIVLLAAATQTADPISESLTIRTLRRASHDGMSTPESFRADAETNVVTISLR